MSQIDIYIFTTIIGLLIAYNVKIIRKCYEDIKHSGYGIRELLKIEIDRECNAAIDAGYCSDSTKKEIGDMFDIYEYFKGNGRAAKKVAKTFELPREPEEVSE